MKDKTGKSLTQGQIVDVFVSDILAAFVLSVEEGIVAGPDGKTNKPKLVLQIVLNIPVTNGVGPCYILQDAEKIEPKDTEGKVN